MSSDPVGSQWLRSVPSAQVTPISAPSLPPSWNSGGVYAEFDQVLEPALKRPRVETKKEALRGGFRSKSSLTWAHILNQPFHGWSQSGSRQDGQPKAKSSSGCHDNASSRPGSQRFPQRPNRPLAKPASSTLLSSATRKNVPLGNVQTKPYVAEPPPAAPRFKHGGKSPSPVVWHKSIVVDRSCDKAPLIFTVGTDTIPRTSSMNRLPGMVCMKSPHQFKTNQQPPGLQFHPVSSISPVCKSCLRFLSRSLISARCMEPLPQIAPSSLLHGLH